MYRYDQFLTSWHISALMLVQVLLPLVVMFVLYAVIIVLYKRQVRALVPSSQCFSFKDLIIRLYVPW